MLTRGIRISVITCFSMFVAACASGPTYQEYESSIPTLEGDMGRIYIYRTSAFGAAVQPEIRLNEEVIGKAVPKGFFYVDQPAGEYTVSASTEAKRAVSFVLDDHEHKYIRLEIKMGLFVGHIKPVLVEDEVGREEIRETKFVGADG